MGIKGLWSILTPHSEKKSLHEISGETVAIDLAGWVCDSQNVTDYYIQPKLYLRNLFFRTIYLLLSDMRPIFVLDGDAPELKRDVMAARNAIQFQGAPPKSDNIAKKKPDVGRKRFKGVLKECANLLKCMGVACVKGEGEAEAMCAQLNAQGIVDAVISQDSDCFAYGARRVYRNFSVSSAAGGGAMQGSVDCYDLDKIIKHNGFGRNKMVALALLCGCDYGVGACGSSITTAVSFLHTVKEDEVIPRLVSWVSDPAMFEAMSRWVSVPGRCDRCGHAGRTHPKNGCPKCVTMHGCNDTGHKLKLAETKRELSLRNRAINAGIHFPEPLVMNEFLYRQPEAIDEKDLKTSAPSLIQFTKLMSQKLDWPERYCVEKFLPLLTKHHLQDTIANVTLKPIKIIKKRVPRGVPSFQVLWADTSGEYDGLIPDEQLEENEDPSEIWCTTERQDLMRKYYPQLVEIYEESIKKPAKVKKPRATKKASEKTKTKKKNTTVNKDVNQSHSTSKLNVSVKVTKLKRKRKSIKNQKKIDSFISNNKKIRLSNQNLNSLRQSFSNLSLLDEKFNKLISKENCNINCIENKENKNTNNNSFFNLSHDEEDSDISLVIDNIVSQAVKTKTAKVNNRQVKLHFDKQTTPRKSLRKSVLTTIHNNCSTPKYSQKTNNSSTPKFSRKVSYNSTPKSSYKRSSTSFFFDKLTDDVDAFEMSVENVLDTSDRTIEYSF